MWGTTRQPEKHGTKIFLLNIYFFIIILFQNLSKKKTGLFFLSSSLWSRRVKRTFHLNCRVGWGRGEERKRAAPVHSRLGLKSYEDENRSDFLEPAENDAWRLWTPWLPYESCRLCFVLGLFENSYAQFCCSRVLSIPRKKWRQFSQTRDLSSNIEGGRATVSRQVYTHHLFYELA